MERKTVQRQAIFEVLKRSARPLGVHDILKAAQKDCAGLGIATVYRNLKAMLEEDLICAVEMPGSAVFYELSGSKHHHHFSCVKCKRLFDISGCKFNFEKILPDGFQLNGHEILLSGLCDRCA